MVTLKAQDHRRPKRTNINYMAKDGDAVGKLHNAVTKSIADKILKERMRGPYESWADLQNRVYGLGAAKMENLKKYNFVVEERSMKNDEELEGPGDLRLAVHKKETRESVWRHRRNKDIYTELTKRQVEKGESEVDHVWEIQVLNHARENVWQTLGPAGRTRYAEKRLATLVNNDLNLNVTTKAVNRAKCWPFKNWLDLDTRVDLDDCLGQGRQNYSIYFRNHDDEWANIKKAVVRTYDDLEDEVNYIADRERSGVVQTMQAVIGEMNIMMNNIHY